MRNRDLLRGLGALFNIKTRLTRAREPSSRHRGGVAGRNVDEVYLDLLGRVMRTGETRDDRTGVGTRSIFGEQIKLDLSAEFPILTTKRVFWKGVKHELLWMLSGSTNVHDLQRHGVAIWDEWADMHGELGPVYGKQWRDFEGVDQIKRVVASLRDDPDSRRHIVTAWNPKELEKMALPPCPCFFQFYAAGSGAKRTLHCHMYQRSADVFLGVPFDIASYALLTELTAATLGWSVGSLTISYGDLHLYENHVEQAETQLTREPASVRPRLEVRARGDLLDYEAGDARLLHYHPHPPIKAAIAV